mgnify:CR=1 FL=1
MISDSINRFDYEILIRKKSGNNYAVYCPQINLMIKGYELTRLKEEMQKRIDVHIKSIIKKQDLEFE